MDMQTIIERAERNIRQAISDYAKHTSQTQVLDDCSSGFISQLAHDSSYAKQDLRELFSQSPVWDENIDALVINGTRTHNPDYDRIRNLFYDILRDVFYKYDADLYEAIKLFTDPELDGDEKQKAVNAINHLAPKAYAPTKKLSRVFKSLCVALGVADETAGSEFQRLYAQFADELTAKKIGFKLYVSINPAHFLSMSNPKCDDRGNTLTSCHSFNSTEYKYNNGCTGYARDKTSFIVFTVSDPSDPETLNNRKTTRQIFAYRPGSGLLMQSRMYNTSGGVYGASEDSKLYRDLVQREISALENVPNLWKTKSATGEEYGCLVDVGDGFGGYADWTYENFDGHISCRTDCDPDAVPPLTVGTWGLCVSCGCETSHGVYCEDCEHGGDCQCDECGDYYDDDELYTVHDSNGNELRVCESCRDRYYRYCDECEEWYPEDDVRWIKSEERYVCDDCLDEYYEQCEKCDKYYSEDCVNAVHTDSYGVIAVCDDCIDEYEECPECGERIDRDGVTCPACGAVIEEDDEEVAE